jgi:dihydrofolate reductase
MLAWTSIRSRRCQSHWWAPPSFVGLQTTDAAALPTTLTHFSRRGLHYCDDIFAAHWPYVGADDPIGPLFDRVTKYVATRNPNLQLGWQNSQNLGADVADAVRRLKNEEGPDLLTQGSTQLLHTLFKHDLVDEIHLSIFPVVLGAGKRLFVDGISPGALKLVSSRVSGSGVTVNKYVRDGQIRTGNFQIEPPTEAELRRRRNLT